MADRASYASRVMKSAGVAAGEEHMSDARSASASERQTNAQALYLRLGFKDGRVSESLPWPLLVRSRLVLENTHRLELIFSSCMVTIEGQELHLFARDLDEGRLRFIQEHDRSEVLLLQGDNAKLPMEERVPIIERIAVTPSFADSAATFSEDERF